MASQAFPEERSSGLPSQPINRVSQDITLALDGLLCVTLIWGSEVVKAQQNRDPGRRKEAREEGLRGLGAKMAKGYKQTVEEEGAREGSGSD